MYLFPKKGFILRNLLSTLVTSSQFYFHFQLLTSLLIISIFDQPNRMAHLVCPFFTSSIVTCHGPLLPSLIHCCSVCLVGHLLTCLQPQSSYAKMLSPSKSGQTKKYSHSKLVLKQNNISPTSIRSSAHLQSLPGIVHCPETYSDDEDDDNDDDEDDDNDDDEDNEDEDDEEDEVDEDDVIIISGLQHSLKIRNYASNSSYRNDTNDYDNNDDDASSSSNHSTIGDGSGGVSNDDYEDNDDDAEDANHEANNDDATNENASSLCDGTHSEEDYISLSCTNQSFQPNVSASESSSFIGPHCNPQWNARSKVKSYDIGEEPSHCENECSISDERVSSVGGGS